MMDSKRKHARKIGSFELLESRRLLASTLLWGTVNNGTLTGMTGGYSNNANWWTINAQGQFVPAITAPGPDDTVDLGAGGVSEIDLSNNSSVANVVAEPDTNTTFDLKGRSLIVSGDFSFNTTGTAFADSSTLVTVKSSTPGSSFKTGPVSVVGVAPSTLNVQNTAWFVNGEFLDTNGGVVVDGPDSELDITNGASLNNVGTSAIMIGTSQNGTVVVNNGKLKTAGAILVGSEESSTPVGSIDAADASSIVSGPVEIYSGSPSGGAWISTDSHWANTEMTIGGEQNGTMFIGTGGSVTTRGDADVGTGSVGAVAVTGISSSSSNVSTWTINGSIYFGQTSLDPVTNQSVVGIGVMQLSDRGKVTTNKINLFNNSSIDASSGSQLNVGYAVTVNKGSIALSGGSQLTIGNVLTLTQGTITLSDIGSSVSTGILYVKGTSNGLAKLVVNDGAALTTTNTMSSGTRIAARGSGNGEVDVRAGGSWTSSGGINVGESVGKGVLRVAGNLQSTGYNSVNKKGVAVIDGTWSISNSGGAGSGTLDVDGGMLEGNGTVIATGPIHPRNNGFIAATLTIKGDVDSSGGAIKPGRTDAGPALGTLTIDGNADLGGKLDIDVFAGQGDAPATCDLLAITGTANLTGGSLHVDLPAGYTPALNTQFVVLTANGGRGNTTFSSSPNGAPVGNGCYWFVDYSNPYEVILKVVEAQGLSINPTEGDSDTYAVATLDGVSSLSGLTATVSWAAGMTPVLIDNTGATAQYGNITLSGSTATVNGTHKYTEEGSKSVRTTFYLDGEELALVDSLATVADAALSVSIPSNLQFYEGWRGDELVATFSDAGGGVVATDFAAKINWGDGTTTAGKITYSTGTGQFYVNAHNMHTYTDILEHSMTVTVYDEGGATDQATENVAACSSSGSSPTSSTTILTPTYFGLSIGVNEEFNEDNSQVLATFTNKYTGEDTGSTSTDDFLAVITWESPDNVPHRTTGTITYTANPTPHFIVQGKYKYDTVGQEYPTIDLYKNNGNHEEFEYLASPAEEPIHVTDTLTVTPVPVAIDTMNGGNYVHVAHFTDSDPAAVSSEYSATMDWGTSDVQILPSDSGGFDVYALKSMAYAGSHSAIGLTIDKTVGSTLVATDTETLNSLLLDSGSAVALDGLPDGCDLTVTNGTSLDLDGSSNTLGTLSLTYGSITNGSITADSYAVENGSISANLAGSGGLTMSGEGIVELTGNNSYTNGTWISGGTLAISSDAALGNTNGSVTFRGAGKLQALGTLTLSATRVIATPTYSSLAATIDTNGYDVALPGGIGGVGGLVKTGDGTLDLRNVDNSGLLGNLTVTGGFILIGDPSNLGNYQSALIFDGGGLRASGDLTISYYRIDVRAGGAIFDPNGHTLQINATFGYAPDNDYTGAEGGIAVMDSSSNGSGVLLLTGENIFLGGTTIVSGTLKITSDDALGAAPSSPTTNITFAGNGILQWGESFDLSANRSIQIDWDSTATIDTHSYSPEIPGIIEGGGNLTAIGSGALTLSGENTYTGITTIGASSETLTLDNVLALQGSTFDTSGPGTLSFGTLDSATFGGLQGSGDVSLVNDDNPSEPVDLTVGGNNVSTIFSGYFSGSGSLTKTGTGTLVLTGDNSEFFGATTIAVGMLEAISPTALPGNIVDNGLESGAILAVCVDGDDPWQAADIDTLLGSDDFAAGANLGIDTGSSVFSYGSVISDPTSGSVGLVVLGSGTLVLTENNTYSGGTAIIGGTLTVQNYSLPTGGSIDVASDATLHYDTTAGNISQLATTFTGGGTLLVDGGNSLIFGGFGAVNVSFSQGALIDVEAGTLVGSSSDNGLWTDNVASLNIAAEATFDGAEAVIYIDALTGDGTFQGGVGESPVTERIGVADGSGTFSGVIQDDASSVLALVKAGTGIQTLAGTNTYSGGTHIDGGMLIAQTTGSLPGYDSSDVVFVAEGATLAVAVGGNGEWIPDDIEDLFGNVTFSSGSTLGIDTSGGDFVYESNIADPTDVSLRLTKLGDNMLTLTGANTYSGGTNIDGGTLKAQTTGSLPGCDSPGVVSVAGGATLAVAVGGTGEWVADNIDDLFGNVAFSSGSALGIDTSGDNFVYESNLGDTADGSLGLAKLGDHKLTLSGVNTYSGGTDLEVGTLEVGSSTALGDNTGGLTVNGGVLYLSGYSITVGSLSGSGGTITNSNSSSPSILTIVQSTDEDYSGTIEDGSGTVVLVISGSAALTLSGENAYSGGTDLESGTLKMGNSAALGDGTGSLTVNGGVLDLNGQSITVGSLSGSGGTITNHAPSSTSTLTVDQSDETVYSGNLQDASGAVSFVMSGSGALVVAGVNTYSSGTTVSSGTLVATNSSALPDNSALTVGAGGTLIFDPGYTQSSSSEQGSLRDPHGRDGDGLNLPIIHAPAVTAIRCVGQTLVDANSVQFTVTFSKAVTGVTSADFAVDAAGLVGTVVSVSGSGNCYTVTVGISGGGTLGLVVLDNGTIVDQEGTPLADPTTGPRSQRYTVDRRLYWAGSAGTFDTGYYWRVGGPTGPLQGWCDGSDVVFAGSPGIVSILNPVVVASMTVLSDGYVLEGSEISLGSSQTTINVAVGSTTIDCEMAGGSLVKTGNGTLVLGGIDSYSCSTTVSAGMLRLKSGSALPAGTALAVNGGILDLGGTTTAGLTTVRLAGGSIVDGSLEADTTLEFYSGTVLADLGGAARLDKFGPHTVILAGHNTYSGGTRALAGTLVATYDYSLPDAATGTGTVIIQPTLYWSGSGDWSTGQWQLADGTPAPWVDGSNVVLAVGSEIHVSGMVSVNAITMADNSTIDGGTLSLPSWGGIISVLSGTATIDSTLAGGGGGSGLAETGPGTLVLHGTLAYTGPTTVAGGTLDLESRLGTAPVIAGGRTIGPGALFSSDGKSLYDLDLSMFNLVQSLFVDRVIDRADMLQILESTADDGTILPSELSALETLTSPRNEARLNVPDYVAVLANDVVHGNRANASYQGQPLGNLADQGTGQLRASALDDLVDKWFYGTDRPATDWGATYSVVAGSLFGDNSDPALNVPDSSDMRQGALGDCYLIAALGALADSSPSSIENMFIDNGIENGVQSWTVRFYYNDPARGYVADYVTVDAMLPGYSGGNLLYARLGDANRWWMPLVEKAYAQWNATGKEGRDGQNCYASLYGGCMEYVDAQILGRTATTYSPARDPTAKQAVIDAIQRNAAVTAAIFATGDATEFNRLRLVSSHAYQVVGYDDDPGSPTFDTFQLRNPWGFYDPTARLTWDDLCAYSWLAVAETSSSFSANSQAAGMSGQEIHAEALRAVVNRQYMPDVSWLADLKSNEKSHVTDTMQNSRIRALEIVLAESGR